MVALGPVLGSGHHSAVISFLQLFANVGNKQREAQTKNGYNVPQEESRERFEEALDVILRAWTSERFSYQGVMPHCK